jgi:hypothetical protein
MQGKYPTNDILTDCSLKSYSMGPKFDQFIQRYAICPTLCHNGAYKKILYKNSTRFVAQLAQHWTTNIHLYLGEFATIFENILEHESGTKMGLFEIKKKHRPKIS